jgi:glycosyltransferase involved in cell wall biosynthesis
VFLGVRDDIPDVMRAMDVFLLPSQHEGLGIAAIEAQASGLPCLLSTGVPPAAVVTPGAVRLPLLDGAAAWADRAVAAYREGVVAGRHDRVDDVTAAGYNIADVADWLQNFYLERC